MRARLPTGPLVPLGAALSVVAAAAWVVLPTVQEQVPPTPDVTIDATQLSAPEAPVASGWETSTETDAEMFALRWEGDPAAEFSLTAELADGTTTDAYEVPSVVTEGHLPDPGTDEAALATAGNVSEPVWLGSDVVSVQVSLEDGATSDVELTEVTSPIAEAPPGSAAAAGGPFGAFDGIPRSIATLTFIVGVGLLAAAIVAVGGRWRRAGVLAMVLALLAASAAVAAPGAQAVAKPRPMIKRAQWGADESRRLAKCPEGPDYNNRMQIAVIHHTAGAEPGSPAESAAIVRGVYNFHTEPNSEYCDIAYNFLVDKFGQVFEGRFGGTGKIVQGAHALHFNRRSLGIAVLGNYDARSFVEDQVIWRYQDLVAWKFEKHAVGNPTEKITYKDAQGVKHTMRRVVGHRQTYATACPGWTIQARMSEIRNGAEWKMIFS
jgi:hypothetical protein